MPGSDSAKSAKKPAEATYSPSPAILAVSAVAILASLVWSYLPHLTEMVEIWSTQPDYSHGFLVPFIVALLLWLRKDQMPAPTLRPLSVWSGMIIITLSIIIRVISARYFLTPVENWMIIGVLTGLVIAAFGWPIGKWAFPAILFLIFAIPLPYQVETYFRQPLRELATIISSNTMVMFGYPAVAEGNTIQILDHVYGVEDACAGLRIFWGIAAFAYAIALTSQSHWIVRILILSSVVPVALVANATRIVVTCMLSEAYPAANVKKTVHDWAGVVMIPYALLLLGTVYLLLTKSFRTVEVVESSGFSVVTSPAHRLPSNKK